MARARLPGQDGGSYLQEYRLKRRKDFERLEKQAKRVYTRCFLLLIAPSASNQPRLGVTVSRKVDKRAVVRNKVKRRIREIFRLNRLKLSAAVDMTVIARRAAVECSFNDVQRQILSALHREGLLQQ